MAIPVPLWSMIALGLVVLTGCVKTHTSGKYRNTMADCGIQAYVRSIISSQDGQFLQADDDVAGHGRSTPARALRTDSGLRRSRLDQQSVGDARQPIRGDHLPCDASHPPRSIGGVMSLPLGFIAPCLRTKAYGATDSQARSRFGVSYGVSRKAHCRLGRRPGPESRCTAFPAAAQAIHSARRPKSGGLFRSKP